MKAITHSDKPQINQRIHQLIKMMHERNTGSKQQASNSTNGSVANPQQGKLKYA